MQQPSKLYLPYFEPDISNPEFIHTVLDGLQRSDLFADKLIQFNVNYGNGFTGSQIRDAFVKDHTRATAKYLQKLMETRIIFQSKHEGSSRWFR